MYVACIHPSSVRKVLVLGFCTSDIPPGLSTWVWEVGHHTKDSLSRQAPSIVRVSVQSAAKNSCKIGLGTRVSACPTLLYKMRRQSRITTRLRRKRIGFSKAAGSADGEITIALYSCQQILLVGVADVEIAESSCSVYSTFALLSYHSRETCRA